MNRKIQPPDGTIPESVRTVYGWAMMAINAIETFNASPNGDFILRQLARINSSPVPSEVKTHLTNAVLAAYAGRNPDAFADRDGFTV